MPTYTQPDKNSRQSSSSKGFFRRHKDRVADGRYDQYGSVEGANGSLGSRQSKRGSVASANEQLQDGDATGLAMTA
ncbi:MAG: hypothetical protein M1823_007573, partial [Watsoniomyces obsoletus]